MGLFVLFSPDPWERWKSWAERRQEDAAKLQAPKMLNECTTEPNVYFDNSHRAH